MTVIVINFTHFKTGGPLNHKFTYGHQTVVEDMGIFCQRLLPWIILCVV